MIFDIDTPEQTNLAEAPLEAVIDTSVAQLASNEAAEEIQTAHQATDALAALPELIEISTANYTALDAGELSASAMKAISTESARYLARLGAPRLSKKLFSLESAAPDQQRQIAMESMSQAISLGWQKIKDFLAKIGSYFVAAYRKVLAFFGFEKKKEDQVQKAAEKAADQPDKVFEAAANEISNTPQLTMSMEKAPSSVPRLPFHLSGFVLDELAWAGPERPEMGGQRLQEILTTQKHKLTDARFFEHFVDDMVEFCHKHLNPSTATLEVALGSPIFEPGQGNPLAALFNLAYKDNKNHHYGRFASERLPASNWSLLDLGFYTRYVLGVYFPSGEMARIRPYDQRATNINEANSRVLDLGSTQGTYPIRIRAADVKELINIAKKKSFVTHADPMKKLEDLSSVLSRAMSVWSAKLDQELDHTTLEQTKLQRLTQLPKSVSNFTRVANYTLSRLMAQSKAKISLIQAIVDYVNRLAKQIA